MVGVRYTKLAIVADLIVRFASVNLVEIIKFCANYRQNFTKFPTAEVKKKSILKYVKPNVAFGKKVEYILKRRDRQSNKFINSN